jgi:glutamate-1-semialdehyde 2,1-aminomutase
VPKGATQDTLVAPYNDLAAVETLFAEHGDEIACIIAEPVAGNMGLVEPGDGFLEGLRSITSKHGALLVFDEVMTGFRVAPAGAVERFGIDPDLVTFGKVVGGGFPLAAYAGKREIMEHVAPAGSMYQAGTLSGNPVATAAGIATLEVLAEVSVWESAAQRAETLVTGLSAAGRESGVPIQATAAGTMAGIFFKEQPVTNYEESAVDDGGRYSAFFQGMLRRGVYLAPSRYEALFLSSVHSEEDIELTVEAAADVMREMARDM